MTEYDVRRIVRQEFAALMRQEQERVRKQRADAAAEEERVHNEAYAASHDFYGSGE